MSKGRTLLAVSALLVAAILGGAPRAKASGASVQVPHLVGVFVARGYAQLHRIGLKITIPHGFTVDSLAGGGEILATSPAAGQRVPVGSAVSLTVGCKFCALGSPGVPTHLPSYTLPDFTGQLLSKVLDWIRPNTLYLTEHFTSIRAATATGLTTAYRVARQHPAPGTTLRLGDRHRTGPNSGSFSPTPLTVWLVRNR